MPGQTIRDVIIRIAIQQAESKLKVPDLAPVKAAVAEASAAAKAATDATIGTLNKGFEATKAIAKSAIETFALQETEYKIREDKIQEKSAQARFKEIALAERVAAFRRNKAEQTAAAEIQANRRSAESMSNVAEGANRAAEGAFRIARGVALISGSEKDMQELVRTVAKVQAGFDLFKGSTDIVIGLNKSLISLQAAGYASAAGMAAPLIPLAALAAAAYLGGRAFGFFEDKAKAAAQTKRLFDESAKAAAGAGLDFKVEKFGERAGLRDELRRTEVIRAETEGMAQQQIVALTLKKIDQERATIQNEMFNLADAGNMDIRRQAQFAERIKTLDQERLATLRAAGDQLKQNLALQESAVRSAQEAVKSEQDRLRSLDEIVGRLSVGERAELGRIGEKFKKGTATPEEIRRAEQLGGAGVSGAASDFFSKRGREFTEGALGGFQTSGRARGPGSQLDFLQGSLELIQNAPGGKGLNEVVKAVNDSQRELERVARELEDSMKVFFSTQHELLRRMGIAFEGEARRAREKALLDKRWYQDWGFG